MSVEARIRRALLFMPGDDMQKIRKGAGLGVDSVIMDLEDGVALNNKQAARETVREALLDTDLDFGRSERLVRVNAADSGWQHDDIRATAAGKPDGFVLPKVESAREVQQTSSILAAQESALRMRPGTFKLMAIIETARGVLNLAAIAGADKRLVGLMFGAEDLAGSMGAIRTAEGHEVLYGRSVVVLHAAAAGLQAIDSPYVDFKDDKGLKAETLKSMQMGYTGKLAIHPAQIAVIEKVYTPTKAEVKAAQTLVEAHEKHQAEGSGVFALDGKMVDMPLIRQAERVLARAAAADK